MDGCCFGWRGQCFALRFSHGFPGCDMASCWPTLGFDPEMGLPAGHQSIAQVQ